MYTLLKVNTKVVDNKRTSHPIAIPATIEPVGYVTTTKKDVKSATTLRLLWHPMFVLSAMAGR